MGMSDYYRKLRDKIDCDLIFMPCAGAIIKNEQGEILLQYPGGRFWSLPAGAIEPGETIAQACVREVWEETGLIVRPKKLLGVFSGLPFRFTYYNGHEVEYIAHIFQCDVVGGMLQPRDDETVDLKYFKPNQMPKLALPYPEELFTGGYEEQETFFEWKEEWLSFVGDKEK